MEALLLIIGSAAGIILFIAVLLIWHHTARIAGQLETISQQIASIGTFLGDALPAIAISIDQRKD